MLTKSSAYLEEGRMITVTQISSSFCWLTCSASPASLMLMLVNQCRYPFLTSVFPNLPYISALSFLLALYSVCLNFLSYPVFFLGISSSMLDFRSFIFVYIHVSLYIPYSTTWTAKVLYKWTCMFNLALFLNECQYFT